MADDDMGHPRGSGDGHTPGSGDSESHGDQAGNRESRGSARRTKHRRVPITAWVVLAVAVVVLAGFLIARPYWFRGDTDDLHVPADRHFTKTLAGLGTTGGAWLTDESPSTSFTVDLPVDAGPGETRLRLRGTTEVAENSTVFLTVTMGGRQVHRVSLPTGEGDLDTTVPVPADLVADGVVRARVSVQGTLHGDICMPDHSAGMMVHLTPDTMIESALDRPVRTVRDAVASWDRHLTIVAADLSDPWRTTAAQLGIALTQHGYDVTVTGEVPGSDVGDVILVGPADALGGLGWHGPSDGAGQDGGDSVVAGTIGDAAVVGIVQPQAAAVAGLLTTPALASADTAVSDPRAVPLAGPAGDDVALGALGVDLSQQTITENRSWHVGYSAADLPGGRLPASVRAAFQLPASPPDLTWILNVQLNGQLVDSRALEHTTGPVEIPLPPEAQRLDNTLVLTVTRDRDLGGCGVRVTSYPIQLLATSALHLGDAATPGFAGLPRALAPGFDVYVPDADPAGTGALLTAALPELAAFTPAQYTPAFRWGEQPPAGAPFVLLGSSTDAATPARLADGRLTVRGGAPALDLSSFADGVLTQCATGPGGVPGLVIQPVGEAAGVPAPDFGQECVRADTAGGGFALDADGAVVPTGPPRTAAPR